MNLKDNLPESIGRSTPRALSRSTLALTSGGRSVMVSMTQYPKDVGSTVPIRLNK
jgi:hypothetical protein